MITYGFHRGIGRQIVLLLLTFGLSLHTFGQKDEELALSRKVEKVGERQYLVTVTVNKGGHEGYAKLQEMIPEGFVPTKKETHGANYIYQNGKAKFIWMDFPSESKFQVVYKLTQKRSKAGTYEIEGRVSCVSGEDLLRVEEKSEFEVSEPEIAKGTEVQKGSEKEKAEQEKSRDEEEENEAIASEESEEEKDTLRTDPDEEDDEKLASNGKGTGSKKGEGTDDKEKGTAEEDSSKEAKAEEKEEEAEKGKEEEGKKDESPGWEKEEEDEKEEKAYFSVQIGAFGEEKSDRYFEERYSLSSDEIDSYREGGLIKYTTGRYGTYDRALKAKKKLRSRGLKGAFVVGFKGSEAVDASALRK